MDKKLWEEVDGVIKPDSPGFYITNMGSLYFDGETFLVGGHKRKTPTTVEWWLKRYTQSEYQHPLRPNY